MNEQDNNQVQPVAQPAEVPATPVQPTEVPATPVEPTEVPVSPVQPAEVPATPVQPTEAPAVPVQPAEAPAQPVVEQPAAQPVAQPVAEQPAAQPVAQPVVDPAAQPVAQPVVDPASQQVPQAAPVQGEVAQAAPVAPATPATPVDVNAINGMINTGPQVGATDATTAGFVPMGEPLKKKSNKGVIITIVVLILIALGLAGYFIVYPMYVKKYMNDPKNVYKTTISNFSNSLSGTVKEIVHNKAIYDINFSIDTNMNKLTDLTGYKYKGNLGIDPEKKAIQVGIEMTDPQNKTYSYYKYLKEGKEYARYSTYRDLIYIGEANMESTNDLIASFNELLGLSKKLKSADYEYLISKTSDLIIESIDESRLSKEDASITINGEKLKVIANRYSIDHKTANNMSKHVMEGLRDDPKVVTILVNVCQQYSKECTEKVIKELLTYKEDTTSEDKESDKTIEINIYTYGNKNDVVGYSMDAADEVNMYYYFKDNYFEIKIKSATNAMDAAKKETVLLVKGNKEGNKTTIKISLDDSDIAELTLNSWTPINKNVDYKINYQGIVCNGNITFTKDINDTRGKYNLTASIHMGNEDLKVNVDFTEDWTSEVANINTSASVSVTESELIQLQNEFMNALSSSPLGSALQTVNGDSSLDIFNYYNQNNIEPPEVPDNPDNPTDNPTE